jgi:hydrogenase maturation protease
MPKILIIGYGNPLRGDDAIGWLAARDLSQTVSSPDVEVLMCHQLTPELADNLQHCDAVLFIDARRDGEPGELRVERISPRTDPPNFSHEISPAALLQLCNQLSGKSPAAFLVSLCGECFELKEGLSSRATAGFPHLMALVNQLTFSKLHQPATGHVDR